MLVTRHQRAALRTAFAIGGSESEAEDVTQEAFVKAFRSLRRFEEGRPLRPWLMQIVANEARNRRRSRGRREHLAVRAASVGGGPSGSAEDLALGEVTAGELRAALGPAGRPGSHGHRAPLLRRAVGGRDRGRAGGPARDGEVPPVACARPAAGRAGRSGAMTVDLERSLVALADSLDFPGENDLADRVVARLEAPPSPRRTVRPFAARWPLAAAAVLVVAVVLVASPRARRAVADLLGIGGVAIEAGPSVPATTLPDRAATVARRLGAGRRPSPRRLGAGRDRPRRLGTGGAFPAALGGTAAGLADERAAPRHPPAGADRARAAGRRHLRTAAARGRARARVAAVGLPAADGRSRAWARCSRSSGPRSTRPSSRRRSPRAPPTSASSSTAVRPSGWRVRPTCSSTVGPDGTVEQQTLRLAGNTLIWTDGPFTYRLESALDRDQAIAVAETVPGTNS